MIATPTRYKFTVENLLQMEQAGVFPSDYRLELISGEIIDMSPIHPPHAQCVTLLNRFFTRELPAHLYIVSIQNPIQLSAYSLPQPDVVVAHYREGLLEKHIQPQDIALLIEVSDSSYDYDRHAKLQEYAAANVTEYWIVNLPQHQFELYTKPEGGAYTQINIYQRAFDTSLGVRLSPEDILPKKA